MSNDYVSKRDELLAKCKSSNELDIGLLIQCDCLNLLDTQSKAFDTYTQSLATFNSDMAKWVEFNSNYGHIISQYQQYEKDLRDWRKIIDYSGIVDPSMKECKYYGNYAEESRDTTIGGIGGGTLHCKWSPSELRRKLVTWRDEHNLPDGVYYPPTVAPFDPGSVMCCVESMKNISNTGTIEFDKIKQNCLLEIQQNIDSGNTNPPTLEPSAQLPESEQEPESSLPKQPQQQIQQPSTPESNNTLWIVLGVIGGVVLLLAAIGIYRRYSAESGNENSESNVNQNLIDEIE